MTTLRDIQAPLKDRYKADAAAARVGACCPLPWGGPIGR